MKFKNCQQPRFWISSKEGKVTERKESSIVPAMPNTMSLAWQLNNSVKYVCILSIWCCFKTVWSYSQRGRTLFSSSVLFSFMWRFLQIHLSHAPPSLKKIFYMCKSLWQFWHNMLKNPKINIESTLRRVFSIYQNALASIFFLFQSCLMLIERGILIYSFLSHPPWTLLKRH